MTNLILLFLMLVALLSVGEVQGYASYFCTRCKAFTASNVYMGQSSQTSSSKSAIVTSNSGSTLSNGGQYSSGESLTLSLSSTSGVHGAAWQSTQGSTSASGWTTCSGKGVHKCSTTVTLTAPTDGSSISIKAAWASGYGTVYYTPTIALTAGPTQAPPTPNPTLTPTANPTLVPTVPPTRVPTTPPTPGPSLPPGVPTPHPTTPPTEAPSTPPSAAPTATPTTAHPTATPTVPPPTPQPTQQSSTFSVEMTISLAGITLSEANAATATVVSLVATALGVSADRVVLLQNEVEARRRRRLELSNSPSNTDTALSSENIMQWASDLAWSTVDSIGKSITRALATGDISLSVQIMGYSSSSAATTAVGTLSTYVGSSVSSGFTSQLNSNAGLSSTGATVASSSTTDSNLANQLQAYTHQCKISDRQTLYWNIASDGASYVNALVLLQGGGGTRTNWLGFGVVDKDASKMVDSSKNHMVYLYKPTLPSVGYYAVTSASSAGFSLLTNANRKTKAGGYDNGLVSVQSINAYVTLAFDYAADTGVDSDPSLSLGVGLANRVMWANGGDWPFTHTAGQYGFTDVYWTEGRCESEKEVSDLGNPYIIWALVGLLLIINITSFSPFEKGGCCEAIKLKKAHPRAVSSIIGNRLAWLVGLDEKHLSSYSAGSFVVIALYILVNGLVLFGNGMHEGYWVRSSGKVAIMNMWLALLPTAKTSLVWWLFGVPYERCVKFHRLVTAVGMIFVMVHYKGSYDKLETAGHEPTTLDRSLFEGIAPGFGLAAAIVYLSMALLAVEAVRTKAYELFQLFHKLYLLGVVFTMLHVWMAQSSLQYGFLPGILLHAVSAYTKWSAKTRKGDLQCILEDTDPDENGAVSAVRIAVPYDKEEKDKLISNCSSADDLQGDLGQYYFINIPAVSAMEWHPFSISRLPTAEPLLTFHVKPMKEGSWTHKLAQQARKQQQAKPSLDVRLLGPFGQLSIDLREYDHVCIIAGGIGITPMLPILNRLRRQTKNSVRSKHSSSCLTGVSIHWVCGPQNTGLFRTFADEISIGDLSPLDSDFTGKTGNSEIEMGAITAENQGSSKKSGGKYKKISSEQQNKGQGKGQGQSNKNAISFDLTMYVTNRDKGNVEDGKDKSNDKNKTNVRVRGVSGAEYILEAGRPDVSSVVNVLGSKSCVLVCGPTPLMVDVAAACSDKGVDFHSETFGW